MFNSQFSSERRSCRMCEPVRQCDLVLHPLRMRIEHWELSIGQIPGRIQGSGFCQVIFARALNSPRQRMLTTA